MLFTRFNRHYFDLLWSMTIKEFITRYKHTYFGFLWAILVPLSQMLIIGTVLSYFVSIPNYYLFLLAGLLPWQFFSFTLTKVTPSFVNDRILLRKATFPREILPLSVISANFLAYLISEVLFIILLLYLQPFSLTHLLYFLITTVWLLLFTIGLSLLTSSYNVRFRDINLFVPVILTLWFYATPILYNLSVLPEKLLLLMYINPIASPFFILQTAFFNLPLPPTAIITVNAGLSLFIFIFGILTFVKESSNFVDWL